MGRWLLFCVGALILVAPMMAQSPVITIVTEPWEPYVGPGLKNDGYLAVVAREAFAVAGYKTNLEYFPWARALTMVRNGQADALLGAFYSVERSEYLLYPDPIGQQRVVLFERSDHRIDYAGLDDLAGLRVGVVRGAVQGEDFDHSTLFSRVELVDLDQGITMLLGGRIDLFAGPQRVTELVLSRRPDSERRRIDMIVRPIAVQKIYCAISKRSPSATEVSQAFTRGLRRLIERGTLTRLQAEYGFGR